MKKQPEIQINLINYKLDKTASRQTKLLELSIYMLIGLLIIGGIFLFNHVLQGKIAALERENQILQAELQDIAVDTSTMGDNQKVVAAIKTRSLLVDSLLKQQKDFVPVYDELGQLNGAGLLISSIDVQDGIIKITGYAANRTKVVGLLKTLRDSELFGDPADLQLSTNEESREVTFNLQMSLEVVE